MSGSLEAGSLRSLQRRLARLYDLPPAPDVSGFLCGHERVEALAPGETRRGEVLLVHEVDGRVEVGLYVDAAALEALAPGAAPDFGAFCLATEGVSHFVYLAFRAAGGAAVTQLELEVQAEVDTFATALLGGWGAGALLERSRRLRRRLFELPRYRDAADTTAGARYRVANRTAARYAAWLEARFLRRQDLGPFVGSFAASTGVAQPTSSGCRIAEPPQEISALRVSTTNSSTASRTGRLKRTFSSAISRRAVTCARFFDFTRAGAPFMSCRRALRGENDEGETILLVFEAVFDGYTGHGGAD